MSKVEDLLHTVAWSIVNRLLWKAKLLSLRS